MRKACGTDRLVEQLRFSPGNWAVARRIVTGKLDITPPFPAVRFNVGFRNVGTLI